MQSRALWDSGVMNVVLSLLYMYSLVTVTIPSLATVYSYNVASVACLYEQ